MFFERQSSCQEDALRPGQHRIGLCFWATPVLKTDDKSIFLYIHIYICKSYILRLTLTRSRPGDFRGPSVLSKAFGARRDPNPYLDPGVFPA